MKRRLLLSIVVLCLLGQTIQVDALKISTEKSPPYNFTENGQIVGACTEIVEAIVIQAGYDYRIAISPWREPMTSRRQKKNTLIFPLAEQTNGKSTSSGLV